MAFTGALIEQANNALWQKLLYVGKIFAVTDEVITGFFDKNNKKS